jgi:hypothetical protein
MPQFFSQKPQQLGSPFLQIRVNEQLLYPKLFRSVQGAPHQGLAEA